MGVVIQKVDKCKHYKNKKTIYGLGTDGVDLHAYQTKSDKADLMTRRKQNKLSVVLKVDFCVVFFGFQ